jgi:periplasmic divalent cation tolerance protein
MIKYCIVISTFENHEQAKSIIDIVLEKRVAACIQTIDIGSHYSWNGEVCHDKEVLVLFKTSAHMYDPLKELLEEIHPYETPEILRVDIEDGSKTYLKWIDDITSGKPTSQD